MRVLAYCKLSAIELMGVDKSIVSLTVHKADTILEASAYSREIALWDTNCMLARQYEWFLHHVLTVNQRLTNLPSIGL